MAKELRFEKKKEILETYNARLNEIKAEVAEHAEAFRTYCFDLAMLKVWKEWNDTIKEGEVVEFNDQMFLESGDENVVELMRLCLDMEEFAGQSLSVDPSEEVEPSPEDLRKQLFSLKGEGEKE